MGAESKHDERKVNSANTDKENAKLNGDPVSITSLPSPYSLLQQKHKISQDNLVKPCSPSTSNMVHNGPSRHGPILILRG